MPILSKNPIKLEWDKMVQSQVIRKVDGPTKWSAGIVKPSREVGICVDLTQLNKSILRQPFVLPTVIGGGHILFKIGYQFWVPSG